MQSNLRSKTQQEDLYCHNKIFNAIVKLLKLAQVGGSIVILLSAWRDLDRTHTK